MVCTPAAATTTTLATTTLAALAAVATGGGSSGVTLPAVGAKWDYQLGGSYTPPSGVTVVERDRTETPARQGYDICYINGFQTQPGDQSSWPDDVLVKDTSGNPLVDSNWPDEYILDTSTDEKRQAILTIVQPWITGCRSAGYHAIEMDNLDSYSRDGINNGQITIESNYAMASMYIRAAHDVGLAIAQKNCAENASDLKALGFDFAISESCSKYSECDQYTNAYSVVMGVEYTDEITSASKFTKACSTSGHPTSLIWRDHDLVAQGVSGYKYTSCN